MSDSDMWTGIVGFLLPLAIAVIIKEGWTKELQAVIAFVACLVAAVGSAYFAGQLDPKGVVHDMLIVFTLAMTSFGFLWKPTGISEAIQNNILS